MSDYIPRLREELVAAAARERAGQRRRVVVRPRGFALAAVAAALAAAVVLAVSAIELRNDGEPVVPPGAELAYRVTPVPGTDAAAAVERAAAILEERIAAAGVDGAKVSVDGDVVAVDVGSGARATVAALAVPGNLAIYDWELSVLGPNGWPKPGDPSVTGRQGAGQAAGMAQYDAIERATKAQRSSGPPTFWLVDPASREVLAGPQWTRDALTPSGSTPEGARVLEVPGGVRVVEGEGPSPARWYALADSAALNNADIAGARAMSEPVTGDPAVVFDFTPQGQGAFAALTREIARRGAAAARPGGDPLRAAQHLAFVLDGQIVSVPFIHFRENPNGIDGRSGAQIQGGLTPGRAREIATLLNSEPMPATLAPVRP